MNDDDTTSAQCADRVLDLSRAPSRADLQMRDGKGSTTWSCDDGFQARAELPDGTVTTMLSRQVSVDSYRAADATTGAPTTVDVHSTDLGVEAAVSLAGQVADDLGIDAGELRSWSVAAEQSETSDDVKTSFMENQVGYVLAQLQVVHQGVSGNNYVHLILSWGA